MKNIEKNLELILKVSEADNIPIPCVINNLRNGFIFATFECKNSTCLECQARSLKWLNEELDFIESTDVETGIQTLRNELDRYSEALDRLDSKIIEIFSTVDGLYDCKGVCEKGNDICHNQCMKTGYWRKLSLKDE